MSEPESKSEIAQLLRRIDLEYQAAQWGLTGFAEGSSKHAFITARAERGAERILRLIDEGKHAEAIALMNTETWGMEEQGEAEQEDCIVQRDMV
jgi:uncharacterized protein YprB with RNaseH-like and TPR domain